MSAEPESFGILWYFIIDRYEDIPVEATGTDVPKGIDSFEDVNLTPIVQANITLAHYTKPTPVQVTMFYLSKVVILIHIILRLSETLYSGDPRQARPHVVRPDRVRQDRGLPPPRPQQDPRGGARRGRQLRGRLRVREEETDASSAGAGTHQGAGHTGQGDIVHF